MSRIDYIFCNENLSKCLQKAYVKVAPVPDHEAVVIHSRSSKTSRGPGYWKLNSSALNDDELKIGIKDIFKNTIEEYENINDKGLIWDLCKIRFKEFSISYCTEKARRKICSIEPIEKEISHIDNIIALEKQTGENCNKLKELRKTLKHKYDNLMQDKAKGAQIRAQAEWAEKGDGSTSYFLRLENIRQNGERL